MSRAHGHETVPTARRVDHLDAAQCWMRLQQTALGRLAVVREDGTPDVFPVNYVAHEGSLYVRTARDSKLLHIAHHPAVAFEIDGDNEDERWSVVARGPVTAVLDEAELAQIRRVWDPDPWADGDRTLYLRLAVCVLTGRAVGDRWAELAGGDLGAFA
jgi:nitroimidazol reductase NimA-like FMN-containing flavoprotein (pyridoxamine 5'-phosphate oxidase superfamily)